MAETALSIIDFLTSRASNTALSETQLSSLVSELKGKINQLSIAVPSASADAVTVLYSGQMTPGGIHTGAVAEALVKANPPGKVLTINQTEIYSLLASDDFNIALTKALGNDQAALTRILDGTDLTGKRISSDSLWDDASRRFAQNAVGDVRVLVPNADAAKVFAQTELPALLANSKVTAIEGIPIADLKAVAAQGPEAVFQRLKSASLMDIAYSGLKVTTVGSSSVVSGADDFLKNVTNLDAYCLAHPEAHTRFDTYVQSLDATRQSELKAIAKTMVADGEAALKVSGGTKVLNKLGLLGGLLGFGLAAHDAVAAQTAGNTEQAKEIMKLWAIDAAGSEVGSLIGAAVGGIALAAAAAIGATVTAPVAGALLLGATLIGGIFGGDAATGIYDLTKDLDDNGKMDLLDKLGNLVFGADYTITSPLPADLNGNRLTLDATFSRDEIVTNAKTDIAWRYALRELNPFVIPDIAYDRHNTDGSLDLYDPATGQGTMTELYLQDRAAMLTWRIRYDKGMADDNDMPREGMKPYTEQWDSSEVQGDWDFMDRSLKLKDGTLLTLSIDGQGVSVDDHQIVFGSKANDTIVGGGDSDHLYGGAGSDRLDGGKGDDYLEGNAGADNFTGGAGNDTLLGGAGLDIYTLNDGDGWDTIEDSDGAGAVYYGSQQLTGGTAVGDSGMVWQQKVGDKTYTYILTDWTEGGETYKRLSIQGPDGGVFIKNWAAGQLGIKLEDATPPPAINKNIINALQDTPPYFTEGTGGDDKIIGGGWVDSIYASGGNDTLIDGGNATFDMLDGESGDDRLEMSGGRDIGRGREGNDTLIVRKVDGGPVADDVFLDGGLDADQLVGSNGKDLLLGGRGRDTLIGGEGGDWLEGDMSATRVKGDWAWAEPDAQGHFGITNCWFNVTDGTEAPSTNPGYYTSETADVGEDDLLIGMAGGDLMVGDMNLLQVSGCASNTAWLITDDGQASADIIHGGNLLFAANHEKWSAAA